MIQLPLELILLCLAEIGAALIDVRRQSRISIIVISTAQRSFAK